MVVKQEETKFLTSRQQRYKYNTPDNTKSCGWSLLGIRFVSHKGHMFGNNKSNFLNTNKSKLYTICYSPPKKSPQLTFLTTGKIAHIFASFADERFPLQTVSLHRIAKIAEKEMFDGIIVVDVV